MATQRPSASQQTSPTEPSVRDEVIQYHAGGFAFILPPSISYIAYILLVSTQSFATYYAGLLLVLGIAFFIGIWLSDRVRYGDRSTTDQPDN